MLHTENWVYSIYINPLELFFGIRSHATLELNLALGFNTLLLQSEEILIVYVYIDRTFQTVPGLLQSRAA